MAKGGGVLWRQQPALSRVTQVVWFTGVLSAGVGG
jgi:hypothetical protein